MDVMNDGLHDSPTTRLMLVETHLLRLLLVVLEDNSKRSKHYRLDNGKSTIRPTPTRHAQERIRRQRTSKSSTDERRAGKGERKSTVPQTGGIRNEDLQDEINRIVTNPVQHVTGGVGVRVVTGRQDDQAQNVDANEDQVALCTTPQVDGLCNGQFQHTTDDTVQDVRGTNLGGGREAAVGFVDDIAVDRRVEGQHEETHPDPSICQSQPNPQ